MSLLHVIIHWICVALSGSESSSIGPGVEAESFFILGLCAEFFFSGLYCFRCGSGFK